MIFSFRQAGIILCNGTSGISLFPDRFFFITLLFIPIPTPVFSGYNRMSKKNETKVFDFLG